MAYEIDLEIFKGPMDLLLSLISKQKVAIEDVSIGDITDQYLEYVEHMQYMDMEVATDFIEMASRLLYIKSKKLLPVAKEDEDEVDPEAELKARLEEYRKSKQASQLLAELETSGLGIYTKLPEELVDDGEVDLEQFTMDALTNAFLSIVKQTSYEERKRSKPVTIVREPMSINTAVSIIQSRLKDNEKLEFTAFFEEHKDRNSIISLFLGMLELLKRSVLDAKQEGTFKQIYITRGTQWTTESISL